MTIITFVGLGLGLAFLLFTKPGQIVAAVLAGAAGVWIFYVLPNQSGPHSAPVDNGPVIDVVVFGVMGLLFASLFVQATRALERTMKDRRERAARLKVLEERGAQLWALEHTPRDGEILPPQRYLSP
jgi:hypothetical protein